MKPILKFAVFILLIVAMVYVSCKKEHSCESCSEKNKPPLPNAGPDQSITLPTDSVSLDGRQSSDPDGTISGYLWTKISGPVSFNIIKPSDSITLVKTLVAGKYLFELTVTDNGGLSAKDTMRVIVDSAVTTNHPPIANAGADQTITLPTNTVNLDGSGSTDPDNNITSYAWTKISGPSSFNISNANVVKTPVTNLALGVYLFELKVTDAGGLFSTDTVKITVNALTSCNQLIPIGPLSIPRETVCAATAGNKILFAGGYLGSNSSIASSRVDIYDMTTQVWSIAELSMPRAGLDAATVGNKIFFAGGWVNSFSGYSSRVDIYDVSTNIWSTAELSEPRTGFVVAAVNNKILFAGGSLPSGSVVNDKVDIYDNVSNSWSTASLSEPRTAISATSLGTKIYFSGGYNNVSLPSASSRVDIYDASTNLWSSIDMSEPREYHATIGADNKIFWASGTSYFDSTGGPIGNYSVEIYNVITGNRAYHQLTELAYKAAIMKNKILFLHPFATNLFWSVDVYDIDTQTWSTLQFCNSISTRIDWNKSFVAAGNNIYAAGYNQVWKLEF
jgi:Uncharacterized protein conserved in bacteria